MIDEELEPMISAETTNETTMTAEAPHTPPPPAAPEPPSGKDEPMSMEEALKDESLLAEYDQSFQKLRRGRVIKVTVIQVEPDRVFVDTGTKNEGVIPLAELSAEPLLTAEGYVNVGDEITAVVLNTEGSEGNPILSKKRADFEDFWVKIEEAFEKKEFLDALVTERVKGGLVVDIGVRGFVPATHVGSGKLRNIERFVGQTLRLKILELDRERRKVVLSNREAEQERRSTARESIFHTLQVGEIVDGTVRRIVDYGAFVDVGGVDGLLHVSEMSWSRVNHPSEVLKEGDEIKVKILRMDQGAGKISLGYRQVLPDPWHIVAEKYKTGQMIEGPISRLAQSGAFVKMDEIEAWLPVIEMANRRVGKPSEVVSEGQVVQVQIIEMNTNSRRMVVSLRSMERQSERDSIEKHSRQNRPQGTTIGERLGALKELFTREAEEPREDETQGTAVVAAEELPEGTEPFQSPHVEAAAGSAGELADGSDPTEPESAEEAPDAVEEAAVHEIEDEVANLDEVATIVEDEATAELVEEKAE